MNTEPENHASEFRQPIRYEITDLPVNYVVRTFVVLAAALALILAVSFFFYLYLTEQPPSSDREPAHDQADRTRARLSEKFSEPRLQLSPAQQLKTLQAQQRMDLTNYSWINKDAQTVRIPIEHAMRLIAERGLPIWTNESGNEAAIDRPPDLKK